MAKRNDRSPRALIVENHAGNLKRIVGLLSEIAPEIQLTHSETGKTALKFVTSQIYDAVFISTQLTDISGFRLAAAIRSMKGYRIMPLVFMGKDEGKRLDVYKLFHCYDYLTIPFDEYEFKKAVTPLIKGILETTRTQNTIAETSDKIIMVNSRHKCHLIRLGDLLFAEICGPLLTIYTKQGAYRNIRMRLDAFIRYVDDPTLIRCHKSFAVNLKNVVDFADGDGRCKTLHFDTETEESCLLGKSFVRPVRDALAQSIKKAPNRESG